MASPEAISNQAYLLSKQGRHTEAISLLNPLLAEHPDFMPAWSNLAVALYAVGDLAGAQQAQWQVHRLAPDSPQALMSAGIQWLEAGQIGQALQVLRQAVRLAPNLGEGWNNLGLTLLAMGEVTDAVAALEQGMQAAPTDARITSNWLMALQYAPGIGSTGLRERTLRARGAFNLRPHQALQPIAQTRHTAGPLRVAYIGGDFRQHPVGWLLAPVLAGHNRSAVNIHLIDTQGGATPPDPLAYRLRQLADHWHSVAHLSDEELARYLQALKLDVLVDLAGHTQGGRPRLFSLRLAPAQLSWLGWFASSGLPEMDGWVLGGAMHTEATRTHATEPVLQLPRFHMAYQAPDYAPQVTPIPPSQRGAPLTFGCFNNTAKLNDQVVACWAQVLHAVPNSQLLLKWKTLADPWFMQHTQHRFMAHGIESSRLRLEPASNHAELLAQYADVDVALDPFPFCGGLTSLEALWMGVPVLTLPGERPVSRQTLALLDCLGLSSECSAPHVAGYVQRAQAIANTPSRLRELRQNLRPLMQASPLCQGNELACALEALYEHAVGRH